MWESGEGSGRRFHSGAVERDAPRARGRALYGGARSVRLSRIKKNARESGGIVGLASTHGGAGERASAAKRARAAKRERAAGRSTGEPATHVQISGAEKEPS